jgi:3-oxoadipate enol-lactonase
MHINACHRLLSYLLLVLPAVSLCSAQQPAASPGSVSSGFVEVDGGKLYYEESGQGRQTVVLIHDGVVNSAVWNDVWPELCKHFHTIRYDRRGFGKSPAATYWYSETDDLAALLHHLEVGHASLVGSSHGAQLAIDFTLAHPEIVQELVLLDPC